MLVVLWHYMIHLGCCKVVSKFRAGVTSVLK